MVFLLSNNRNKVVTISLPVKIRINNKNYFSPSSSCYHQEFLITNLPSENISWRRRLLPSNKPFETPFPTSQRQVAGPDWPRQCQNWESHFHQHLFISQTTSALDIPTWSRDEGFLARFQAGKVVCTLPPFPSRPPESGTKNKKSIIWSTIHTCWVRYNHHVRKKTLWFKWQCEWETSLS